MDVQGYLPPHRPEDSQNEHYAHTNLTPTVAKSQTLPSLQSLSLHDACKQHRNYSIGNDNKPERGQQQQLHVVARSSLCKPRQPMSTIRSSAVSKRKSSPAILGVPLGLSDEEQAQLSLHLSRQRNSIEAAMLLANLKRLPSSSHATTAARATPTIAGRQRSNLSMNDNHRHRHDKPWSGDDNSVTSPPTASPRQRRHSYDATMAWSTMPASFLERSTFYHDATSSSVPSSSPVSPMTGVDNRSLPVHSYHRPPQQRQVATGPEATKITWFHNDTLEQNHAQYYAKAEKLPPMLHHHHQHAASHENSVGHTQHSLPGYHGMYMGGPTPSLPPQLVPGEGDRLHPLAQSEMASGQKREHMDDEMVPSPPHHNINSNGSSYYYPYSIPSYAASTPHQDQQQQKQQQLGFPHMHAHQESQQQQMPYFYHPSKVPLLSPIDPNMRPASPLEGPPGGPVIPMGGTPLSRTSSNNSTKRRRNRADADEDDMANAVEPGDPDFPDMSLKDIEAARVDPEARPRRQKLRYLGDKYTPQWVRYNGQAKEGLCDTCQPGKWLQLKNSAFWYHKQFFHGISSVSGKEFIQPLETRWVDHDLVEGLCHQCHQWVSVSNVKRKNSVLWFRHAHKCHVYHKPKPIIIKRR
ncbi:hypothetical protein BX666DRAFT_1964748 [Dichotomocladium elegans]|nr:hypothetical protein BX666DRAFT_1964748 [Dichotomocladium elegans]